VSAVLNCFGVGSKPEESRHVCEQSSRTNINGDFQFTSISRMYMSTHLSVYLIYCVTHLMEDIVLTVNQRESS
jgi:hypothetical protein